MELVEEEIVEDRVRRYSCGCEKRPPEEVQYRLTPCQAAERQIERARTARAEIDEVRQMALRIADDRTVESTTRREQEKPPSIRDLAADLEDRADRLKQLRNKEMSARGRVRRADKRLEQHLASQDSRKNFTEHAEESGTAEPA